MKQTQLKVKNGNDIDKIKSWWYQYHYFFIIYNKKIFSFEAKSSLSVGDTSIRLPGLNELNFDSDSSGIFTKVLKSKDNSFASVHGNTTIQGSVITIILSRPDGSEMPVKNTTKSISIRLTRPIDKWAKFQEKELHGTSL